MKVVNIATDTITTIVEFKSSSREGQDTLVISDFTFTKKFLTLFICLTSFLHPQFKKLAGAEGVEPSVTVLETVGLPLTDAPVKPTINYWQLLKN